MTDRTPRDAYILMLVERAASAGWDHFESICDRIERALEPPLSAFVGLSVTTERLVRCPHPDCGAALTLAEFRRHLEEGHPEPAPAEELRAASAWEGPPS